MMITPDQIRNSAKFGSPLREVLMEIADRLEKMDAMSASWWWMLKHRIAVKLGMTGRFE
jgi:hypothetical protein